jgi:lysophospholipase L1-like esterase
MKRIALFSAVTIFISGCGSKAPVAPTTDSPTTASSPTATAPPPRRSKPPAVVFIGDSITSIWGQSWASPAFAEHPTWNDQGIVGQNSYQLRYRFQVDVIDPHPDMVHILTGTNDVYPGWVLCGGSAVFDTCDNIKAMVAMAQAAGITPMLATIPPWGPGALPEDADPSPEHYARIEQLNGWIKEYGQQMGLVVIDYHGRLLDADGKTYVPDLTLDGVHPSPAGYDVMTTAVEHGIAAHLVKLPTGKS